MKNSVRVLIGAAIGAALAGAFGWLAGATISAIMPMLAGFAGFGALLGLGAGIISGPRLTSDRLHGPDEGPGGADLH